MVRIGKDVRMAIRIGYLYYERSEEIAEAGAI